MLMFTSCTKGWSDKLVTCARVYTVQQAVQQDMYVYTVGAPCTLLQTVESLSDDSKLMAAIVIALSEIESC